MIWLLACVDSSLSRSLPLSLPPSLHFAEVTTIEAACDRCTVTKRRGRPPGIKVASSFLFQLFIAAAKQQTFAGCADSGHVRRRHAASRLAKHACTHTHTHDQPIGQRCTRRRTYTHTHNTHEIDRKLVTHAHTHTLWVDSNLACRGLTGNETAQPLGALEEQRFL